MSGHKPWGEIKHKSGPPYACPCCGDLTLEDKRGSFEICRTCFWEDCGHGDEMGDEHHLFGPNGITLSEAKENYKKFGAVEERLKDMVSPRGTSELDHLARVGGIYDDLWVEPHTNNKYPTG